MNFPYIVEDYLVCPPRTRTLTVIGSSSFGSYNLIKKVSIEVPWSMFWGNEFGVVYFGLLKNKPQGKEIQVFHSGLPHIGRDYCICSRRVGFHHIVDDFWFSSFDISPSYVISSGHAAVIQDIFRNKRLEIMEEIPVSNGIAVPMNVTLP